MDQDSVNFCLWPVHKKLNHLLEELDYLHKKVDAMMLQQGVPMPERPKKDAD